MKMRSNNTLPMIILACVVVTAAFTLFHGCTALTKYEKKLNALTISPADPHIAAGSTQQFTVQASYSDNTTSDMTNQVTWSSSNTAVATISNTAGSNGLATAQTITSTQATVITATEPGGVSATTTLTVVNLPLVSIDVTPTSASIAMGTVQQFTATGIYSDGTSTLTQDLSSQATWTSSDPSVTVSATGLAMTTVVVANLTISASKTPQGGGSAISGSATLTVTNATLQSIAVTPATATVGQGKTKQFTATGTFSDSTTQDITSLVAWSSSDTSVATIDSTGLATVLSSATKGATATITATASGGLGSSSGSATLTVP